MMKAIGQAIDRDALAGEAQRPHRSALRSTAPGRAGPSAPKNTSPRPCSARWQPTEAIKQHQHRCVRDRLKRDAIEEQSDRRDDQQRQRDIDRNRGLGAGEPIGQGQDGNRQDDVDRGRARHQLEA